MKHTLYMILLGTVLSGLIACGGGKERTEEERVPESGSVRESGFTPSEEPSAETLRETAAENSADGNGGNLMARQIEEQTFPITLDGWGEVTFASFAPEETSSGGGDVEFKLIRDGQVIYDFPGYSEENLLQDAYFNEIRTVAFRDFDSDGRKDIIIINRYANRSEAYADESYDRVRLYSQRAGENEFVMDKYEPSIEEFLMKQHYCDSIENVMKGVEEYWSYAAEMEEAARRVDQNVPSFYGTWNVQEYLTANIYALSEEEIKELLNSTVTYSADTFSINGTQLEIADYGYKHETTTIETIEQDYRVDLSTWGGAGGEITASYIRTNDAFFGSQFFIADENTIWIYHEGVFFLAHRV